MNSTDSLICLARNLSVFGRLTKDLTDDLQRALERQDLAACQLLSSQLLELTDSGALNTRIIKTFVDHRLSTEKAEVPA